jgi:hypothetical protein
MSRFFCKTNPIEHSIPLIPNGLYCLDTDISDYACDIVDEQYATKCVACANLDWSEATGLKQNDITTKDRMMKDFGRLEVTTQIDNDHVESQGPPLDKHKNSSSMLGDMAIDYFAALSVHILESGNTFIENTFVHKILSTQNTYIDSIEKEKDELTIENNTMRTTIVAQEKQVESLKDVVNHQTWLVFTDYGYGFFQEHRNIIAKFTVNYAVKQITVKKP